MLLQTDYGIKTYFQISKVLFKSVFKMSGCEFIFLQISQISVSLQNFTNAKKPPKNDLQYIYEIKFAESGDHSLCWFDLHNEICAFTTK